MKAHLICQDLGGITWYLGARGRHNYTWIPHEALKSNNDLHLLVYGKREDAEVSAAKIGDGAYAITLTI